VNYLYVCCLYIYALIVHQPAENTVAGGQIGAHYFVFPNRNCARPPLCFFINSAQCFNPFVCLCVYGSIFCATVLFMSCHWRLFSRWPTQIQLEPISPPDHPIQKLFIDVCAVTRSNNCTRHILCRIVRVDLLSSPPPLEPWPWCRGGCRPSLLSVYIVLLLNFHQWLILHVLHRHTSPPLSKQFDYCLLHIRLYMIACLIDGRIDTSVSNWPLLDHCLVLWSTLYLLLSFPLVVVCSFTPAVVLAL
jgi:hypothetical protein